MAIGINENCKKQISKRLEKLFEQYSNTQTDIQWIFKELQHIDNILPKHGHVYEKIRQYIGSYPWFTFIISAISDKLKQGQKISDKHLIYESLGYNTSKDAAKAVVRQFDTLPFEYLFTFRLNEKLSSLLDSNKQQLHFSESIWLANSSCPLVRQLKGIAKEDHSIFFQIRMPGFIPFSSNFFSPPTIHQAISFFKSFIGISFALGIFEVESFYKIPQRVVNIANLFHIHRVDGEELSHCCDYPLSYGLTELINRMVPGDRLKSFYGNEDKSQNTRSKMEFVNAIFFDLDMSNQYQIIKKLEKEKYEHIEYVKAILGLKNKLLSAAEWFVESQIIESEAMAFVQAIIVLEILYSGSDTKDFGIMKLIGNRLAYSIGKHSVERDLILKRFENLYETRSKIVHRGKKDLLIQEEQQLSELKELCFKALLSEINCLPTDWLKWINKGCL